MTENNELDANAGLHFVCLALRSTLGAPQRFLPAKLACYRQQFVCIVDAMFLLRSLNQLAPHSLTDDEQSCVSPSAVVLVVPEPFEMTRDLPAHHQTSLVSGPLTGKECTGLSVGWQVMVIAHTSI